ncbi:exo-beta-N-acetylmuramidase NamZ domain-containing protein, partial [Pseudomonas fluorescens]
MPSALPALHAAARLPTSTGPVQVGIDVLEAQQFAPLAGLRVGLITNRSGFDARGRRTIDVLAHAPGVRLAALFSPEHGLDIDVDERVGDTRDTATGLTVHSLYGATQRFPAQSLRALDALVFDIQDAGVRFFTYETTLGYALEAAAARGIA